MAQCGSAKQCQHEETRRAPLPAACHEERRHSCQRQQHRQRAEPGDARHPAIEQFAAQRMSETEARPIECGRGTFAERAGEPRATRQDGQAQCPEQDDPWHDCRNRKSRRWLDGRRYPAGRARFSLRSESQIEMPMKVATTASEKPTGIL